MSKNQPFTYISDDKKTQSRIRLELGCAAPWQVRMQPINHVGTKLSSICSPQMYIERTPNYRSPASSGVFKITVDQRRSTVFSRILQKILPLPFRSRKGSYAATLPLPFSWRVANYWKSDARVAVHYHRREPDDSSCMDV